MIPFFEPGMESFRLLLGAPLVLWLPGYAFTAALFDRDELDPAERTLMTLGSSISIAILVGLGLSLLGFPLTTLTWGVGLAAVTLGSATYAWRQPSRRPRLPQAGDWVWLRTREWVLFGTAALLLIAALGVARLGFEDQPRIGFTELSLVPGAGDAVHIGVQNEETSAATYRVVLRTATATIADWPSVQLQPGQRWDLDTVLPANRRAGVELVLYRVDAPDQVYRRVGLGSGAPRAAGPSPIADLDRPTAGDAANRIVILAAALAAASLVRMWWAAWRRGTQARHRSAPVPVVRRAWPSVSVIVPAWEERATIGRCMASLRTVDYPSWETIIVAGGSDDTYGAAQRECEHLPNCRVIEQQPLGKPAALNAGLRAATGEIIVLLDADSRVSPQWLRAIVSPMGEVIRATTGNPMPSRQTPITRAELMERIAIYDVQQSVILQGSGGIAVTRDLIDQMGGFPESAYADDWDLDARLASAGIARAYCAAATLLTERPATLAEYWRNELRWRRAHLISLFQLPTYFFRDTTSTLRNLYPYIAAWVTLLLAALTIVAVVAGGPELGWRAMALWGITISWLALQRIALVLQVIAYTGDRRWLRDAWAPPVLFLITLAAAWIASLTTRRATLHFKGPRRIIEDDPAL